jgi:glycosyltransferase involved in cell wall biosynthesis
MHKLLRITTVSDSLSGLLKGQLRFLNQYYEVVGVASDTCSLQEVSEREGIRVVNLPMERDINLWKDCISLIGMIRLIRYEKPYIVHANTPKGSLLAMLASWWCRVPIRIYTVTGLRFETASGIFRRLLVLMERITCACATKVIPEGEGVKNTLIKNRITKKPLRKILNGNINGIDTAYFDPALYTENDKRLLRNELHIGETDFVFIYVGRLVKDKGINELVAAFSRLKSEGWQFLKDDDSTYTSSLCIPKLLLVGTLEQKLDPLLTETLEKIQSDRDIIYVGYQNDVRPYLSISNALVFPSYREGFPNVVMQAGAMGLPSIVTDINGCNEIILEGKNGIIIPPKNKEALSEAMKYMIEHPTERRKMAEAARPLIASRYEQQAVWNALLEEYRSLESAWKKRKFTKEKNTI